MRFIDENGDLLPEDKLNELNDEIPPGLGIFAGAVVLTLLMIMATVAFNSCFGIVKG